MAVMVGLLSVCMLGILMRRLAMAIATGEDWQQQESRTK
jgi:hypothetical protein